MTPGLRGLIFMLAMPLAFERADFLTPAPRTTTFVPLTRFAPCVTRTFSLSGLPSALSIFDDVTVSVRHTARRLAGRAAAARS